MPHCTLTPEYTTLLAKKEEFDTLLETAQTAKTPEESTTALDRALILKAELIEGKRTLEDKLFVSIETATLKPRKMRWKNCGNSRKRRE